MKASISSPVSSLPHETEFCRVTQWANAWAEHFRHNLEEQSLADTLGKDDLPQSLTVAAESESTKMSAVA